jgi:chromate transporter
VGVAADLEASPDRQPPTLGAALRFWLQLGLISFGGPAGQIAIMHRELVERRRWIDESHFLDALNCCTLLPGPEAQQLATYVGWRLHGVRGALIAGGLFVLPAAVLLAVLSWIYAEHGQVPAVAAVLAGVRPAVVAIVAAALIRLGRKSLESGLALAIALAAFVALRTLAVPFPLIVLAAAALAAVLTPHGAGATPGSVLTTDSAPPLRGKGARRHLGRLSLVVGIGLGLWLAGFAAVATLRGSDGLHSQLYRFFSQTAVVTLGGAYSVLTYVAETMGPARGWVTPTQTLDGLALAETTPGPLIMVLEFLGYMAGSNHPASGMTPVQSGLLGAGVATYATFLPSFVFVLAVAPYVERLRGQQRLRAALTGVSAAVLGGIAHLALSFAGATFFPGGFAASAPPVAALVLAIAALAVLLRTNCSVAWVVLGSGSIGWILQSLGGFTPLS